MNINNIRNKVDVAISGKPDIKDILSINIENKHFDIPILSLISAKIHFPYSNSDANFIKLLSIYRNIEIEKDKNKHIFEEFKTINGR
jgi:hypothetical protein